MSIYIRAEGPLCFKTLLLLLALTALALKSLFSVSCPVELGTLPCQQGDPSGNEELGEDLCLPEEPVPDRLATEPDLMKPLLGLMERRVGDGGA